MDNCSAYKTTRAELDTFGCKQEYSTLRAFALSFLSKASERELTCDRLRLPAARSYQLHLNRLFSVTRQPAFRGTLSSATY